MSKALANLPEQSIMPIGEIPSDAPPLPENVENLSFYDLFAENYFSLDGLQELLDLAGADSLVLTVKACTMQPLYDPSKGEKPQDAKWMPCFSFEETSTMLVLNKSRSAIAKKITGSPFPRHWHGVGKIELNPGILNGNGQIVFKQVKTVDDVNADLFPD